LSFVFGFYGVPILQIVGTVSSVIGKVFRPRIHVLTHRVNSTAYRHVPVFDHAEIDFDAAVHAVTIGKRAKLAARLARTL
jgi:hypothetical protein